MLRKVLLACGILSSLLYAAMTAMIAMQWQGYDSASQTISELSAIGAPTRSVWSAWGAVYTVLVIAFGWGVIRSSRRIHALQRTGTLMSPTVPSVFCGRLPRCTRARCWRAEEAP